MNKSVIRKQQTARRLALTEAEVIELSAGLVRQFATLDFKNIHTLHLFLPIAEKKEPDTFLLIRWLKENHPQIKLIVPRADFKTSMMTHHVYPGEQELQKSLFNILEPVSDELHTGDIDMVLVPLLAFDDKGYRVGYGKGFYDRFLEGLKTIKIGLSLFESVGTITDTHENDIRLDLCITPERIIRFNP